MAANDYVDTLNGLFQNVYADKEENLIPNNVKLTKEIDFVNKGKRNGADYKQAVILKSEHGVTYAGSDGDLITFNAALPGLTKQATILPSSMYLRSAITYEALSRSMNDDASFANATAHVVQNMLQSFSNKYEQQMFYGGVGLATISAINTATKVITITTAEWASGIWVGAEGMNLEAYVTGLGSKRTGTAVVTAVDLVNRTLTVDALPTSLATTDVLFEKGAKGKEFIGVHKMLTTTSGTIFGLETSSYSLWQGNQSAVGGALSFAKISKGIATAVAKGVTGKLSLFVNPSTWSNLLTEQTAQRVFHEGGMSEYDQGAKRIMFYSQNGEIEIISSSFVKEGYAYALDLSCFLRIGSKDISFEHPLEDGKFIMPLENTNAYQIFCHTDSALFCSALGRHIVFSGIVNS